METLTIRGLCDELDGTDIPVRLLVEAAAAADESYATVTRVDGRIAAFFAVGLFHCPDVRPDGWWIIYAWTAPAYRGRHYGSEICATILERLNGPYLIRRKRSGRTKTRVWSGRYGYQFGGTDWRFFGLNHRRGYRLFVTDQIEPWEQP